jgi:hypothetical protein
LIKHILPDRQCDIKQNSAFFKREFSGKIIRSMTLEKIIQTASAERDAYNGKKVIAVKPCDTNINRTLKLVDEMIALADQGDVEREDVGCGIMYGILRDAAYRLKKIAEQERKAHQQKGWWQENQ